MVFRDAIGSMCSMKTAVLTGVLVRIPRPGSGRCDGTFSSHTPYHADTRGSSHLTLRCETLQDRRT